MRNHLTMKDTHKLKGKDGKRYTRNAEIKNKQE
jgi:hypothetical protein